MLLGIHYINEFSFLIRLWWCFPPTTWCYFISNTIKSRKVCQIHVQLLGMLRFSNVLQGLHGQVIYYIHWQWYHHWISNVSLSGWAFIFYASQIAIIWTKNLMGQKANVHQEVKFTDWNSYQVTQNLVIYFIHMGWPIFGAEWLGHHLPHLIFFSLLFFAHLLILKGSNGLIIYVWSLGSLLLLWALGWFCLHYRNCSEMGPEHENSPPCNAIRHFWMEWHDGTWYWGKGNVFGQNVLQQGCSGMDYSGGYPVDIMLKTWRKHYLFMNFCSKFLLSPQTIASLFLRHYRH